MKTKIKLLRSTFTNEYKQDVKSLDKEINRILLENFLEDFFQFWKAVLELHRIMSKDECEYYLAKERIWIATHTTKEGILPPMRLQLFV